MNILLRKIEPEDLPFLYQWENDASAWANADNHNPLSHQDLRAYIASTTGDIYRDGQLRLIIEIHAEADNRPSAITAGCIDLFNFDPRNRKAAMGIYIAPEYRKQGVGKMAVQHLEKYAFNHLALRMLYAIISVSNSACSHLYSSLGYIPSALLKAWTLESDAVVWQKERLGEKIQ